MKRTPLLIFSAVLLVSNGLLAYDKTIKDNYGRTTGYLKTTGDKVYTLDKYGRRESSVDYKGRIKDNNGRTTGYLKQDGYRKYYIDKHGRRSGYIESNGTIKDKYGRKKGFIK